MTGGAIAVSVIIPTYRDWPRLRICLLALARQEYPSGRYEVIVVNNDPGDPCPELRIPGHLRIVFASEVKVGSYAARNAGIALANGEVLVFTDSDCIPARQWLPSLVHGLEQGADRVTGPVELFHRKPDCLSLAEMYEDCCAFRVEELAVHSGWCPTANMATWRRIMQAVGPFKDTVKSGGDREWGERATAMGYNVRYESQAKVLHPARATMHGLLAKWFRLVGGAFDLRHEPRRRNVGSVGVRSPIRVRLRKVVQPFVLQGKRPSVRFGAGMVNLVRYVFSGAMYCVLACGLASPPRK